MAPVAPSLLAWCCWRKWREAESGEGPAAGGLGADDLGAADRGAPTHFR